MPQGNNPPTGIVASALLEAIQDSEAKFDSEALGFELDGTTYFLLVERGAGEHQVQWLHATPSQASANDNPLALLSSGTFTVMHNGQWNSSTARFSYNGKDYSIDLTQSGSHLYATAVEDD